LRFAGQLEVFGASGPAGGEDTATTGFGDVAMVVGMAEATTGAGAITGVGAAAGVIGSVAAAAGAVGGAGAAAGATSGDGAAAGTNMGEAAAAGAVPAHTPVMVT